MWQVGREQRQSGHTVPTNTSEERGGQSKASCICRNRTIKCGKDSVFVGLDDLKEFGDMRWKGSVWWSKRKKRAAELWMGVRAACLRQFGRARTD